MYIYNSLPHIYIYIYNYIYASAAITHQTKSDVNIRTG